MRREVAERFLETFFRRWWLYLVPLLLCCVFGGLSVVSQPKQYLSQGVLSASPDTLLGNLSDLGNDRAFSFETPATVASRRINEQLRSDEFIRALAVRAGIQSSLETGLINPEYIRTRVAASPDGENLLKVGSMTGDPELSVRLATATIDTFIQFVIDEDLSDSSAAQEFYSEIASDYLTKVESAQDSLDEYLVRHPAPPFGDRPPLEQSEMSQLTSELERVESRYSSALAKVEDASLAMELSRLDITQRLRVVDPPVRPVAPVTGMKQAIISIGIFVALGSMMMIGLVALVMFLDKTVTTVGQVKAHFGLNVLATVPAVDLPRAIRER
jgi:hypothetical protein